MAAPPLPTDVKKLRESLLRDQAPSARSRSNYFDPSVFASRHARPYSSRRLSLETLMEMRTDALLRFSQLVALVPIFTGKWRIECVAEDQRILMADGSLKAVQDIRPGDEVLSSDGEEVTRCSVSNAWSVGERDCYQITFSDGREIVVTGNHPIYGWRGWKFAGELQPGDPICFAHETPEQDGALSHDDAFLLALWLAEGSKRKASYEVCCGTPGVLERLREICDKRGWTYTSMRDGLVALVGARWRRVGDTPKNLLREHGCWGQSTDTITVPHAVMAASSHVVAEFLATYVACDGGATSTGIKIVSTSERMARDLQILFARIGAHAYVQSRQPDREGHARQWFVVVGSIGVKRLTDLAHVYGKHERIVATISERARDSVVPPEWLDELPAPEYAGVGRPATALKAARAAGFNPRRDSWSSLRSAAGSAEACGADELAQRLDGQLAWTRVERVEMVGKRPTYDLEVADKHTFFVDGVLTHNCANAQKASFIDHALRRIIGRIIVQFYESWNFGFQGIVKQFALMDPGWVYFDKETGKSKPVWDGGPQVPALVWDSFVTLSPKMVMPVWTDGGAFNGIALAAGRAGNLTFPFPTVPMATGDSLGEFGGGGVSYTGPFSYSIDTADMKKVDVDHSLWVTNERDSNWGSVWGGSRLAYAYKYWWSYEMTLGILNRSVERKGDPTIVVSYPQGASMVDGTEVSNQIIAQQIGQAARSGAVLTVPSEVWGEDVGTANQASKWRIDYLKAEEQFDKLQAVLHYLDTQKIRSMAISELAFAEGTGGCLDAETPILCPRDHGVYPDGVPLWDIEPGRLVWAFNEQSQRFELWPVKGVWRTMQDAERYKLTLDDGTEIVGTPDHPFMSRDGVWRRMDELKPGDRLMPLYESGRDTNYSGGACKPGDFEPMILLDPDHGTFEIEYRAIGQQFGWTGQGKRINIHHGDGRHANTELSNLEGLTPGEHAEIHFRDPEWRRMHSDSVRAAMAALPEDKRARLRREHWDEERWKAHRDRQAIVGLEAITKFRDSLTPEEYKRWCTTRAQATQEARERNGTTYAPPKRTKPCKGCSNDFQPRTAHNLYCQTCSETRNSKPRPIPDGAKNHRVLSVEPLHDVGDVWDLEIDGPPHVRNFVAGGVVVHNTSSRNVAAVTGERSFEVQVFTQVEWDEVVNRYMIPQLADANFPELRDVPARKVTSTFGQDESQLAADMLRSISNADPGSLPIDKPALLERFQIDTLSGGALERFQQSLVDQAQASKPPPTPAQPGGPGTPPSAGVTDTGFYYDAPERIELEDEALLAALPQTRHYTDRAVLAQTRLVRRLWHDHLAAAYEDFAEHVAKTAALAVVQDDGVSLAEEGPQKRAERIVAAWRFAGAKVIKATATALSKIIARAGALELSASRVKAAFDPAGEDVDAWSKENVAALGRHVDRTTREQLQKFVAVQLREGNSAAEIAKNLRAHFSGFPDWRADMIARTEAMRFYNAGTLFAAQAAGARVQALDAQNGPTDPACESRNGRVYPIADAWRESVRVHPRDTLAFRIVPLGVEFVRHPREEMGSTAARIDQEERVVHLAEDLDPATESRYLERAVDWMVASE